MFFRIYQFVQLRKIISRSDHKSRSITLFKGYTEHSGACRNANNRYDDRGSEHDNSVQACQQRCDATKGCGAVSWNGSDCHMTSDMAYTTSESGWKCYSKVA